MIAETGMILATVNNNSSVIASVEDSALVEGTVVGMIASVEDSPIVEYTVIVESIPVDVVALFVVFD